MKVSRPDLKTRGGKIQTLVYLGRKYLRAVSTTKNPAENEIIINVPLALKIMTTGFIWPISAWEELVSGDLIASKDEITVSPR